MLSWFYLKITIGVFGLSWMNLLRCKNSLVSKEDLQKLENMEDVFWYGFRVSLNLKRYTEKKLQHPCLIFLTPLYSFVAKNPQHNSGSQKSLEIKKKPNPKKTY